MSLIVVDNHSFTPHWLPSPGNIFFMKLLFPEVNSIPSERLEMPCSTSIHWRFDRITSFTRGAPLLRRLPFGWTHVDARATNISPRWLFETTIFNCIHFFRHNDNQLFFFRLYFLILRDYKWLNEKWMTTWDFVSHLPEVSVFIPSFGI